MKSLAQTLNDTASLAAPLTPLECATTTTVCGLPVGVVPIAPTPLVDAINHLPATPLAYPTMGGMTLIEGLPVHREADLRSCAHVGDTPLVNTSAYFG